MKLIRKKDREGATPSRFKSTPIYVAVSANGPWIVEPTAFTDKLEAQQFLDAKGLELANRKEGTTKVHQAIAELAITYPRPERPTLLAKGWVTDIIPTAAMTIGYLAMASWGASTLIDLGVKLYWIIN